jgi:hypothetical protein
MQSAVPSTTDDARTSRFPCELIPCVHGVSDRAGSVRASRCRHARYCLPLKARVSAPRSVRSLRRGVQISQLNGQPACTPTDASPSSLRTTTHGLGPVQFATLSLLDSFIPFNSPVLTGALPFWPPQGRVLSRRRCTIKARKLRVGQARMWSFPTAASPRPRRVNRKAAARAVAKPVRVRTLTGDKSWAETGWFSSPGLVDLDGDGKKEIVAPFYSLFVFDSAGNTLATIKQDAYTKGRIYAPAVVADLEGDGVMDIVAAGNEGTVAAYEWKNGTLAIKAGWPASTTSGGQSPEGRGMAAADLDGDGKIEVVVTTTNTSTTGAQVFVFSPNGKLYQPAGTSWQAWPRYNTRAGLGGDTDTNGIGQTGYGCYGLNVGIGNIDDDAQQEIIVTYDNHQINAFKADGTSITASPYFTNRDSKHPNAPFTWGQFIRWADPVVEENHYHLHVGDWPDVNKTMWLQWTASPPSVADINGDGKNDVVGIPNAEMKEPYETQGYAFMVLQGAYGDGSTSAMRLPGWETLPMSASPRCAPTATGIRPTACPPQPSPTSSATAAPRSSRPSTTARSTPWVPMRSFCGAMTLPRARPRPLPRSRWLWT